MPGREDPPEYARYRQGLQGFLELARAAVPRDRPPKGWDGLMRKMRRCFYRDRNLGFGDHRVLMETRCHRVGHALSGGLLAVCSAVAGAGGGDGMGRAGVDAVGVAAGAAGADAAVDRAAAAAGHQTATHATRTMPWFIFAPLSYELRSARRLPTEPRA